MKKLSEERIEMIAKALSGLTETQWIDVRNLVEKLYHPTKKALTSEEISAMLTKNCNWI